MKREAEKTLRNDGGRDWSDTSKKPRDAEDSWQTPENRKRQRKMFCQSL